MSEYRRLAIMGGTFDPVHYGHLLVADEALERFSLDRVVFVPNGIPAHKKSYEVSGADERYAMCRAAIASNPKLTCSRVEIERAGVSYAIDTIRWFRAAYPSLEDLFFITGADAIVDIRSWRSFEELGKLCEFIVATRPGTDSTALRDRIEPSFLVHVHFMTIPGIDISSRDLRARVASGRSIKYRTPEEVESYIRTHGLYRPSPGPPSRRVTADS